MIRILLLFKQGNRELKRLVHPNAVYSIKLGNRALPERILEAVWTQDTKVKHDVWQDGGDHRKAPDCEAGLPVEPQNHTDCCKRDAGQPAQQAINAINHVERINGRPDGK